MSGDGGLTIKTDEPSPCLEGSGVNKLKSNRFWLIVLGVVVTVSAVIALLLWQVPANYARIYKSGELFTGAVNLRAVNQPYLIFIDSSIDARSNVGGLNVIEIERGRIRMLESDCPLNVCVHRGWVSGGMMPIVCFPNRVVITFEGRSDDGIDAVVG